MSKNACEVTILATAPAAAGKPKGNRIMSDEYDNHTHDELVAIIRAQSAENTALTARVRELDCRYAGGGLADFAGSHCPLDEPCCRCENETLRADVRNLEAGIESQDAVLSAKFNAAIRERDEARAELAAEVAKLKEQCEGCARLIAAQDAVAALTARVRELEAERERLWETLRVIECESTCEDASGWARTALESASRPSAAPESEVVEIAEKDVHDIVMEYLERHGFDGLYDLDGECACEIDDLAPCGEFSACCAAGYKYPCDCGDHDFHIGAAAARYQYFAEHADDAPAAAGESTLAYKEAADAEKEKK